MQVNQLTQGTLRSLAEVAADEPVVVSVFMDLEPGTFAAPDARESQISSLLHALGEEMRGRELSHDAAEALDADRERIETFLRDELDASGARAIAIYSALALDVFEVIKLADAVDTAVHVDLRPVLEPIMGHEDEGAWCVLLVTRETARIFRGGPTGLREIHDLQSDVKNQHQAGGWSQARFQRSVEQEVEWHLERAADVLFRYARRRPFEHLVIGADNDALRPSLTGETHAYLLEKVRGWVDIDERLAREDEVFEAVRAVMDAYAAEQECGLFDRFGAELATGGRAAAGVVDVLAALVEQRVETLLVREGASAEGTQCVTCGWMGAAGPVLCPVDETRLDRVENIVEPAIQAAIRQSAAVHVVEEPDDRDGDRPATPFEEPVAAVLRF
jgi:peptide chain release factor subunit 1